LIDTIKGWMLSTKMPKAKKQASGGSINELRNIGIIYDATSEAHRGEILNWTKNLAGRQITTLGFYNNKIPLGNEILPTYCLKDMNWYDLPASPQIDAFTKNTYDMVIFASQQMKPHMAYILANTKSKMSAGPDLNGALKYFDLIVEMSTNPTPNSIISDIITAINKVATK
jgi:hypothetical protein